MAQQINFKSGLDTNISKTSKEAGTVYFAVDTQNKIGKIYLDHDNTTRVNIVPERLDCGSWSINTNYKAPSCCFVPGTKIVCDMEGNVKNIEEITSGETIISYNIFSQEFYPVVVQKLIVNTNTTHIAFILLDNGTTLEMNAYHPIYTINGFHSLTNYNNYDTLVIGDVVKCFDGYHTIIDIVENSLEQPIMTYNLAIKDITESEDDDTNDTFIANGCVVHNAACPT